MLQDHFHIFRLFFYLGCISFGGPTAHLALFQKELIEKRKWMSHIQYIQLMAICQVLPGPSSSQVGMALGFIRSGYYGAFFAWLGFTLPAAIILSLIGVGLNLNQEFLQSGFVHGLKIAVFAVVANAVIAMIKQICTSIWHYVIIILIAGLSLFSVILTQQLLLILISAVIGIFVFKQQTLNLDYFTFQVNKKLAIVFLLLFFIILSAFPFFIEAKTFLDFFYIFYRAGALVFGGGHVVLPILEFQLVPQGWLNQEEFLAGYGVIQALPGPLFNFSSYIGAVSFPTQPILGGCIAVVGIFLPSALILFGTLPFIQWMNQYWWIKAALSGVGAGVIGILAASLYQPIFLTAIFDIYDILIAVVAFVLLYCNKLPVWLVVILCGISSNLLKII